MALILVIDDSALARSTTRKILEQEGYKIIEASDGEEGLKMLFEHSPDCVLMDLLMPGMSGKTVLEQLRSTDVHIPVIIITADIQDSVRDECLELGAFSVINKPLLFESLLNTVKDALGEKDK